MHYAPDMWHMIGDRRTHVHDTRELREAWRWNEGRGEGGGATTDRQELLSTSWVYMSVRRWRCKRAGTRRSGLSQFLGLIAPRHCHLNGLSTTALCPYLLTHCQIARGTKGKKSDVPVYRLFLRSFEVLFLFKKFVLELLMQRNGKK
jgi:hypothetical protein